jgi:prevent-host-death family protein
MATSISAADANRQFSQLLRRVREGHSIVITSHGPTRGENRSS